MSDSVMKSLLKKYNVPAPRYTSYPTVPYWETTPTADQWIDLLNQSIDDANRSGTGAAIYIHIPFCETLCTYCGCNTRITKNHDVANPYIDLIHQEWSLYKEKLGRSGPLRVSEIHLGGGTPTFLSAKELKVMLEPILRDIEFTDGYECSVEVDPRVTNYEQLEVLADLGFRRISLGIQDFDPKVQEIVNRIQPYDIVKKCVEDARSLGYSSVNFDLIYGLPYQNLSSVRDTLNKVGQLLPERIAFYAYAHVPWIKPSHRKFTEDDLPNPDEKRALYELGRELLAKHGYQEIGMDHFSLEKDSLWQASKSSTLHRNFMGYTSKQVSPLFGLGVSAIGDSWAGFVQNEKVLEKYRSKILAGELPILRGHVLTGEDKVLRRHILNLMTSFETEWHDQALKDPFLDSVSERLEELVKDGLVEVDDKRVRITETGMPFIRNISMAFDARLARRAPNTSLFSQSI